MKTRSKITLGVLAFGAALLSPVIIEGRAKSAADREFQYQLTAIHADTDCDGMTTHEEWRNVYKQFKKHYDVHTSNPREDLTTEQMEQYSEMVRQGTLPKRTR